MRSKLLKLIILVQVITLSACGSGANTGLVQIDLDKSNPERLLQFYFGAYTPSSATNPMESGLIVEREGVYYLNRDALPEAYVAALSDGNGDELLDWDELEPFLKATYYSVRPEPAELRQLLGERAYGGNPAWLKIEVDGVMTVARRRVFVERTDVLTALAAYKENQEQILYETGTLFIGEHVIDEEMVEITVMRKREDGFWDYYVYDSDGNLAPGTATDPRPLEVPTRCVGCHFGGKKFEPENSYPSPATDGPHGPRRIYTDIEPVSEQLVEMLDEHNKRSDTVLGLYATVILGEIEQKLAKGEELDAVEAEIAALFSLSVAER